jgi:predicted MFS family arabinose efflux permease
MTNALKDYITVTAAYWAFMLTDGALRMLVLLHFHEWGYSPLQLAFLFLLYEFFGIVTNLFGGWLANRFGLKSTLVYGLALQVLAILMLSGLDKSWSTAFAVAYVMCAQALSGIAKDLTKMSSKTAIKFLIPKDEGSKLFKWVAVLTGSKNAIKGAGFFTGAWLLQSTGFQNSLWIMATGIFIILVFAQTQLPKSIGKAKKKSKLSSVFSQSQQINQLSAARVFLFGARDIWFVVGVPIFLHSVLHWSFSQVGSFMAFWVIAYGFIQASAPLILKRISRQEHPDAKNALQLITTLCAVTAIISIGLFTPLNPSYLILIGLFSFGAIFALNSSVHSFLILDYSQDERAAINVGFYYMANAAGRLIGTLMSGLLYQLGGLAACLIGSTLFLALCSFFTWKLTHSQTQIIKETT